MREVQASDVARGKTIVIALHGRSIARIVPEARGGPKRIFTTEGVGGWPRLARRCEDPMS